MENKKQPVLVKLPKGYGPRDEAWFPFAHVLTELFGFLTEPKDDQGHEYMVVTLERKEQRLILASAGGEDRCQIRELFALDASSVPDIEKVFSLTRNFYITGMIHGCELVRAHARKILAESLERI